MKKNRLLIIFILICSLAAGLYFTFGQKKAEPVSYKTFYDEVSAGKIAEANLSPSKITFKYNGGQSEFQTENPGSPTLKEHLLLNGVQVKEEQSADQIVSNIFDAVFYIIFFGVIVFSFRKFISPNTFKTVRRTGVKFGDIVGMEDLKKDMMQISDIMKHPGQYKAKGIRMPKGILLEGAPGNGKTLFARALAGEAGVNFIPAKATDFESMFMAIGPAKVKLLFAKARRQAPCIVFIDEFDGIGTKRNYSGSAIETENTRIVTALLNELDGFTPNSGILVLVATNSREALDPALIRPGRFDAKYTVPYPDKETRELLVKKYAAGKAFSSECSTEKLAASFQGFSCAQIESVINRAALICQQSEENCITMNHIQMALKEI